MNTMIRTVVGLGLVALIASPAAAQGQGRGGFGRGGGSLAGLLGNASVQKELKLDDTQTEKAKEVAQKINEEFQERRQALRDLEPQEQMTKGRELNREINAAVVKAAGEFLKPEQITRLHQISYQQQGIQAFSDPEVAKKLNLTDAQKAVVKSIQDDSRQEMQSIMQGFQDDREGTLKKLAEFRKETLAKATAKLNDEQQKTWKELLGAPFEIQFPPRNN